MSPFLLTFCFLSLVAAVDNAKGIEDTLAGLNTTKTTTTTTTTSATTTPVVPTPTVPVYDATNGSDICLRLQMNVKIVIPYYNKQGEPLSKTFYLNTSSTYTTSVVGLCSPDVDSIQLQWWPESHEPRTPAWSLLFSFKRLTTESDAGQFSLNHVAFNYSLTDTLFPQTNETVAYFTANNQSQFTAPIGSFFQCMAKQTVKLTTNPTIPSGASKPEVFVSISNLRVEAFRSGSNETFVGTKRECSADFVPNKVVPIVVGVALAVMIVIALVTFIIGSRRRLGGYQEI